MTTNSKIALVSGASSGIGKAIAKQLIKDGLLVCTFARRFEEMDDLVQLGAKTYRADVTKEEEIIAVVTSIQNDHGPIDVLVNNAGFGLYGAVEDTSLDDARYQFEVNVFGLARLTQLVLPSMRERQTGSIINISSIGGKIYSPLGSWYHATKHAVEGWSDCLRLEVARYGVNVVIIEPGAIKTRFGPVATEHVLRNSGQTNYSDYANAMAKTFTNSTGADGVGSPPSVIADAVSNAVHSRRPKTRYAAGKYSTMMLTMRKWLSDRVFDRVSMSAFG